MVAFLEDGRLGKIPEPEFSMNDDEVHESDMSEVVEASMAIQV